MANEQGYTLTGDTVRRVSETVRRVLSAPAAENLGVQEPAGSDGNSVEQWAQATSLTLGSATIGGDTYLFYPGQLYQRLTTSGDGDGIALFGTCWLNMPNGEVPSLGVSYRCISCGTDDDGRLVLDAVVTSSGTSFSGALYNALTTTALAQSTPTALQWTAGAFGYDTSAYKTNANELTTQKAGYHRLYFRVDLQFFPTAGSAFDLDFNIVDYLTNSVARDYRFNWITGNSAPGAFPNAVDLSILCQSPALYYPAGKTFSVTAYQDAVASMTIGNNPMFSIEYLGT